MSSYRGGSGGGAPKVRKVMTQAINLMFEFLKNVRFYSLLVFPVNSNYIHICFDFQ